MRERAGRIQMCIYVIEISYARLCPVINAKAPNQLPTAREAQIFVRSDANYCHRERAE